MPRGDGYYHVVAPFLQNYSSNTIVAESDRRAAATDLRTNYPAACGSESEALPTASTGNSVDATAFFAAGASGAITPPLTSNLIASSTVSGNSTTCSSRHHQHVTAECRRRRGDEDGDHLFAGRGRKRRHAPPVINPIDQIFSACGCTATTRLPTNWLPAWDSARIPSPASRPDKPRARAESASPPARPVGKTCGR